MPSDENTSGNQTFSVTELARDLNITPRSLRFYEDKGLLTPARHGTTRVYSTRDRARVRLIIRGKQLGFHLRDIKDYLDLYDADPKHHAQKMLLLRKVQARMRDLNAMNAAIAATLSDLENIQQALLESFDQNAA
ncbi:MerR family transcriptional regulator [Acetobacter oeni]|uniref:MerR family transcriptional regulator n=1 Tax=Acetobacter oeni TaxID=304077 RepID=A0A511XLR6_9PROT|nr:MerR family DNA-binding transcriptional regulator [Acetobacter oeni]MBB3884320.1 DNA-binding transcriptional MerR regulator [Acetobacter oeni]NHO20234.1 MerR family transcriptional regulator [Acetobacter oeni]GBR07605.1 putative transcriptional regulator [Acetobacter oeni LMG 21952]GEN63874.1 MerR family transcriptional regulator [Acetobacter oeni]